MGVIIAFALMVFMVYKKSPMPLAAVVAAIVMCLLSGLNVVETMTGAFMEGTASFIKSNLLLFFFSAIYAAVMDASGAAHSLGKWLAKSIGSKLAIWGVSFAALVLTYGGISCFVIVFAMYPIALVLYKEANISHKLIPATIGAGAFLAPNTLLGSPALCNLIPAQHLGTDPMAAPVVSIVASLVMYLTANIYLVLRNKSNQKKGIGFVPTERIQKTIDENEARTTVNAGLAVLPLVAIIVTLNVLKWNVLVAVCTGTLVAFILFWNRIDNKFGVLINGSQSGISSVMNTAPVVGLGNVAKLTNFFNSVVGFATGMQGSPLVSWTIAAAIVGFITSSGSGAQAIIGGTLAPTYLAMGVNAEILHRILSCAILGPANTPWNGTMCLTMAACDCSHKDSYLDLLLTTLIGTVCGLVVMIVMGGIIY